MGTDLHLGLTALDTTGLVKVNFNTAVSYVKVTVTKV
jgi:hypothetical protein